MRKIENKDDFILLDVRTPMEFEEGYIEGAILIPYMELERRHLELKAPKDKEIVVYCKAGVRSKKGAKKLVELGYTNVKNMDAGTDGWAAAGGEFVKPTTTPQHTTMPPLTETSPPPTTTWAPTTMPPTTTAPPAQYFEGEPNIVVPKDKETQFSIIPYDVVQIGDAMLYYTYDPGHCVGLATWEFGIFRKEEGNWLYENTVGYTEGAVYPDIPPTDWSQMIHDKTDALDNYDILVKYGTGGKLTVTSIPK
ncbi:MAG: rhodanese-like domain-containing protein [Candidatus Hydrothermarchaeales archaeon]